MIGIGEEFPYFSLPAVSSNNDIVEAYFDDREWNVVYFYPKDFTFICPTEIADMDCLVGEAIVTGISGDNEYCKLA